MPTRDTLHDAEQVRRKWQQARSDVTETIWLAADVCVPTNHDTQRVARALTENTCIPRICLQDSDNVCSAHFCHLNHFFHIPPVFCQFISTTFVNLTTFVNSEVTGFINNITHLCRYRRGHYFCQRGPTTSVNRNFIILCLYNTECYAQSHFAVVINCCFFVIYYLVLVNQILPSHVC